MNKISALLLPLLLAIPTTVVVAKKHHMKNGRSWEFAQVDWDESFAAYVPYPPEAVAGLPNETSHETPPVFLAMTVNVAQWDQPLFSLLKGIVTRNHRVVAFHNFYIQDGWISNAKNHKTQCRHVTGQDPETGDDITEPVDSEDCKRDCTNAGRYCLNQGTSKHPGHELVRESARRMCFDIVYEPGSSILWEYIDAFELHFDCHNAENMTTCSAEVLDEIMNDKYHTEHGESTGDKYHKDHISQCIYEMGGLDGDRENFHMESTIKTQKSSGIDDNIDDLPILEINGQRYEGDYHVDHLFDAVCEAFPPGDVTPYACEYCLPCMILESAYGLWNATGKRWMQWQLFGPLPTKSKRSWGVGAAFFWTTVWIMVAVVVLFSCKQYRTWNLKKELEINRQKLQKDIEGESLDTRNHGKEANILPTVT